MVKESIKEKAARIIGNHPVLQVISRYFTDNVGSRGAALAYYLLFSVFPLVILFSSIISSMHMDIGSVTKTLSPFLPSSIVSLITGYLTYIENDYTTSIMYFSLVFSIYFPWRAVKGLMYDIRMAFRQNPNQKPRFFLLRELFCTLIIPISFVASLLLVVIGRSVIEWVVSILPPNTVHLSGLMLNAWQYARFGLAAIIMSLALTIIYQMSLDHPAPFRRIFPGTVGAILFWIAACVLFSEYVENFGHYSVVYGTLGAVIVLLLWLYLSGIVFIMGAELNAILLQDRHHKNQEELSQNESDRVNKS